MREQYQSLMPEKYRRAVEITVWAGALIVLLATFKFYRSAIVAIWAWMGVMAYAAALANWFYDNPYSSSRTPRKDTGYWAEALIALSGPLGFFMVLIDTSGFQYGFRWAWPDPVLSQKEPPASCSARQTGIPLR